MAWFNNVIHVKNAEEVFDCEMLCQDDLADNYINKTTHQHAAWNIKKHSGRKTALSFYDIINSQRSTRGSDSPQTADCRNA